MSDAIATSRPSSSTSHHPADTASVHSHGTSTPALLTPIGTPPCPSSGVGPTVLGASHGSSSSSGLQHLHNHPGHTAHPQHAHAHHFNGGRWNPFSEAKLQALLSPFDAGSGWREAHGQGGGQGDVEGMMRKMDLGEGQARFEKRALSPGAGAGAGRSGLSMTALPTKGAEGKGIEDQAQKPPATEAAGEAEATAGAKNMARRQSMPEGESLVCPQSAGCLYEGQKS